MEESTKVQFGKFSNFQNGNFFKFLSWKFVEELKVLIIYQNSNFCANY